MKNNILPNTKRTIFIATGILIFVVGTCLTLRIVFDKDNGPSESTITPISPRTPIPIQLPGWEDVTISTLCLDISQEYPEEWFFFFKETLVKLGLDITPKQYSFPYDTVIGEIMQSIGVEVVEKGAQCDARLGINVEGIGKVGTYGKQSKDRCYTGSYVSMGVVLSSDNRETYEAHSSGQVLQSDYIFSGSCPDQAYKAPFTESSAEAITNALVDIWGPDIAEEIRKHYYGSGDIEKAMRDAAKEVLSNPNDQAPAEPEAEPPSQPDE
jgi:hypothetical protein